MGGPHSPPAKPRTRPGESASPATEERRRRRSAAGARLPFAADAAIVVTVVLVPVCLSANPTPLSSPRRRPHERGLA
eukprot:CAMPEP_0197491802 /NCGR_PEP_ID=MMETSP1311-20131121/5956_1 /TAXON_ID=464262 /ORGANISM="Genus nov. species nov., Strain RCC856" /LENGTH=76 /DNA_ID=CAMNT_0043036509 /DNA_START=72 /DNA_END=299 /DNA_ORIENTATION=+